MLLKFIGIEDEVKIKNLEGDILKCEKNLNEISYNFRENYYSLNIDIWTHQKVEIENHLRVANLERNFLLERRNGWKSKIFLIFLGALIPSLIYLSFDIVRSISWPWLFK